MMSFATFSKYLIVLYFCGSLYFKGPWAYSTVFHEQLMDRYVKTYAPVLSALLRMVLPAGGMFVPPGHILIYVTMSVELMGISLVLFGFAALGLKLLALLSFVVAFVHSVSDLDYPLVAANTIVGILAYVTAQNFGVSEEEKSKTE